MNGEVNERGGGTWRAQRSLSNSAVEMRAAARSSALVATACCSCSLSFSICGILARA